MSTTPPPLATRRSLAAQLHALGLRPGDAVMAHAGLRAVGRVLGGPDSLIAALLDVLGPDGTLLAYADWEDDHHDLLDADGRMPAELRDEVLGFDPARSRALRDNGAFAELVRTTPGALRSGNPGASCVAIGGRAAWFVAGHSLDYGYGDGSPLARLVEARGKVLMIGAPLDAITLLHHAEHLAAIPDKRVIRVEAPFAVDGGVVWRTIEEFDTFRPVADGLDDDYFETVAEAFRAEGGGRSGPVGAAVAHLFPAAEMVAFGVRWLEAWSTANAGAPR